MSEVRPQRNTLKREDSMDVNKATDIVKKRSPGTDKTREL